MKFGKVLTYKDIEEAKKLIGKKVVVSDLYWSINNVDSLDFQTYELLNVDDSGMYPFVTEIGEFQFIREVIEEDDPKRMTNRQLSEWLARGNGWVKFQSEDMVYSYYTLFEDDVDKEVPKGTRIRLWSYDEWIVPTLEIYERDCKRITDNAIAEDMVIKV